MRDQIKKVILVRPQNLYGLQNYPPMGLVLLASVLDRDLYQPQIIVSDGSAKFARDLAAQADDALLVGMTATTAEIKDAISLARVLKDQVPGVPLVWGGWHATLFPTQMENSDLVDHVVVGDGEDAFKQIVSQLAQGCSCQQIGRRTESSSVQLSGLPRPRYELIPEIGRFITSPLSDKFMDTYHTRQCRWLPYQTSRGCPHACSFCINPVTGNRNYRFKDPIHSAREMVELADTFGLTHIKIIDDNLFVRKHRVLEMFREVGRLGGGFTWDAECRIDYFREEFVDDRLLALLKKNGLVQLTFGIESGSPASLARMRKGYRDSAGLAHRAVGACARHDITVRGSFVLDIPGDSPEDIFQTVDLIRRLRRYGNFSCGVHTYRPYPGSPLCETLIKGGRISLPDRLESWADEAVVKQFTDTTVVRKWQDNYKLSSGVSFYESLESGFWLKRHQLPSGFLRWINRAFTAVAKLRNQRKWYHLPFDKWVYVLFKDYCLKHQAHVASKGKT